MPMKSRKTKNCPYCGETIPSNAAACPRCGSDERTGWSHNTYLDGIDLGDDFDYEEVCSNEFTKGPSKRYSWVQIITGIMLLLIFIIVAIRLVI